MKKGATYPSNGLPKFEIPIAKRDASLPKIVFGVNWLQS
jgi:hypothetical protein